MNDLVEVVRDAVRALGYSDVSLQRFSVVTASEGVYVRERPASVVTTYMDGTRELSCPIDVMVRSASERAARARSAEIADVLQVADLTSRNGSYELSSHVVSGLPQEIEVDKGGYYTWAVTVTATIQEI